MRIVWNNDRIWMLIASCLSKQKELGGAGLVGVLWIRLYFSKKKTPRDVSWERIGQVYYKINQRDTSFRTRDLTWHTNIEERFVLRNIVSPTKVWSSISNSYKLYWFICEQTLWSIFLVFLYSANISFK